MNINTWLQETTINDVIVKTGNVIVTFVLEWPELVAFEAGCLLLAIGLFWLINRKKTPQGEADEMKRRGQLESVYADRIHDFMLDMLVKGEITRKEYKRDCKRFGIAFRLLDLLRNPRSKIGIKYRVIRNVKANHATLPFIQPGPGPKPATVTPNVARKPKKVWVVVGKRRSAA